MVSLVNPWLFMVARGESCESMVGCGESCESVVTHGEFVVAHGESYESMVARGKSCEFVVAHGESCESMVARGEFVHRRYSSYALTNLLFGLFRPVCIIDLLINLPSPHPEAPTRPSTCEVS